MTARVAYVAADEDITYAGVARHPRAWFAAERVDNELAELAAAGAVHLFEPGQLADDPRSEVRAIVARAVDFDADVAAAAAEAEAAAYAARQKADAAAALEARLADEAAAALEARLADEAAAGEE